jgi:hypothetical protein
VALALLIFATGAAADVVVYSQGFEADDGSWVAAGAAQWAWGTPTNVGPPSAHTGVNCWGTNLSGNLSPSVTGSVTSPAIPVPAVGANETVRASFWLWSDMGTMTDRGEFQTSSDGTTWTKVVKFYERMATGWQRYEFNVTPYAGGNLYLRFYTDKNTGTTPGMYVDDIAVTVRTKPATAATFTLVGWEDPSTGASCPWVFTWDGTQFARDNDIYSVGRYPAGEYTDFYLLKKPLVASDGRYNLEVREVETENSFTDMVGLLAVDHESGVGVGPDQAGGIHAYRSLSLVAPAAARDGSGVDVLAAVAAKDDSGIPAYDGDTVDLDFTNVDLSAGAHLIVRIRGFVNGTGEWRPYTGPPAVVVNVAGADGTWQEAGRVLPRFSWSEGVFDLTPFLAGRTDGVKVRLRSISHETKYHEIDYVALAPGAEPAFNLVPQPLLSATAKGADVRAILAAADGQRVEMHPDDSFAVSFSETGRVLPERDFIFVSRGYYVPSGGTFLIYTWDGSAWVQRDARTTSGSSDTTMAFDLSLFLPDPAGEFKVRVWQDYKWESARIDFAGLVFGSQTGTLSYARDLRGGGSVDVIAQTSAIDGSYLSFGTGNRDRWSEYRWTGITTVLPPSTNPVAVAGSTISWVYADPQSLPQASYYVEVWTGSGGSGTIMWNPAMGSGTGTSVTYAGSPLSGGLTYYARVRSSNGTVWGGWSETSFVASVAVPTTTSLISSPNPACKSAMVTFTATVAVSGTPAGTVTFLASRATFAGTPTGMVTFLDGSTTLGAAPLVDGVARFSTNSLAAGRHAISAAYAGSASFLASTSAPMNQVIESSLDLAITAPAAVCAGSTDNVATVTEVPNATYLWQISGGTITGRTDAAAITWTADASGFTYLHAWVTRQGGANCSRRADAAVPINLTPAIPAITVPRQVSHNQAGLTASVPFVAGSTWTWTVEGGTLTAGQGTASITFTASDSPSLTLRVAETNAAGCTSPAALARMDVGEGDLAGYHMVPIVLDVAGKYGSRFTSELTLSNSGTTPVDAVLTYTPAAVLGMPSLPAGPGVALPSPFTVVQRLEAGHQLFIPDAIGYLKNGGVLVDTSTGSRGGTLRITFPEESGADACYAGARTTAPSASGRAGVAYAGGEVLKCWSEKFIVTGLRENAADRSNLALLNAGVSETIVLRVTLFSGDPAQPGVTPLPDVSLGPGQWAQIDSVLSRAGLKNGWAVVERVSGSDPFEVYGVFNDNVTNDGSFVPMVRMGVDALPQVVPVIVDTRMFTSELVLTNITENPVDVKLSYTESLALPYGPAGFVTTTLAPYEQKILPGAVSWLRTLGADIPSGPNDNAGSLIVSFASGGVPVGGLAGARTGAPAPGGGQYGVFTAGVPVSGGALESAYVYGLSQNDATRSNLAVVNVGENASPITIVAEAFDGSTGIKAGETDPVILAPGGWHQFNQFLSSFGLSNGYARIRKVAGTERFVAYGVVNDGGANVPGTNDGSYIPMDAVR